MQTSAIHCPWLPRHLLFLCNNHMADTLFHSILTHVCSHIQTAVDPVNSQPRGGGGPLPLLVHSALDRLMGRWEGQNCETQGNMNWPVVTFRLPQELQYLGLCPSSPNGRSMSVSKAHTNAVWMWKCHFPFPAENWIDCFSLKCCKKWFLSVYVCVWALYSQVCFWQLLRMKQGGQVHTLSCNHEDIDIQIDPNYICSCSGVMTVIQS